MPVLSQDDRAFWEENGYVVVHDAVPPENVKAAEQAVWRFLEMDRHDPETWYTASPRESIMVEIYQHQALWDNRQYPRVHQAFAEIWGTEKLWVSFDRASMNPPERPGHSFPGKVHWDIPLETPIRFQVQGVLYLSDTDANQGAFTCVPGFHNRIEAWIRNLPPDADPKQQDLKRMGLRPIAGKAGDLIIWHSALPHGSSPNTADQPRVVQYITMFPAKEEKEFPPTDGKEAIRSRRIKGWQDRLAGFSSERKEKEHECGETAELTLRGKKLLGLEPWEGQENGK